MKLSSKTIGKKKTGKNKSLKVRINSNFLYPLMNADILKTIS